jgi:TonB family protein
MNADMLLRSSWLAVGTHLWQTTLVLVVVAVLARLLRTGPGRLQGALWTAALAKLLLPLALLGSLTGRVLSLLRAPMVPAAGYHQVLSVVWDPLGSTTTRTTAAASPPTHIGPAVAITVLWAAGALWLLLRTARDIRTSPRDALKLRDASDEVRTRIERALDGTAIDARGVSVGTDRRVPCVAGLWRPRIMVPARAALALGTEELRAILLHEDAHRRRGDLWLGAAQRIAQCVFFFYPPVWLIGRRLRHASELACDERVLASGVPARAYAGALARALSLGLDPAPGPALPGDGGSLAERFRRIGEADRYAPRLRHRAALGAGIALVALGSLLPRAPMADGAGDDLEGGVRGGVEGGVRGGVEGGVRGGVEGGVRGGVDGGVRGGVEAAVRGGVEGEVQGEIQGRVQGEVRGGVQGRVLGGVHDGVDRGVRGAIQDGIEDGVRDGVEGDMREALSARDTAGLFALPEGGDAGGDGDTGAAPKRLKASEGIEFPELVSKIEPRYPDDARAARVEGQVILDITIDESGVVRDVSVLRGIEGWLSLEQEAVRAVKQWRYRPALDHGRPVATSLMIFIQFSMDGGELGKALARLNAAETKITLSMHDVSLFDLLLELTHQASIPWIVCKDGPRCEDLRVTADWNQVTVRAALLDLAARYRLRYDVDPDGVDVTPLPLSPSSLRTP